MPTAFVTGGSGFVGGALIERLGREGWDVRALARSERAAERVRALGAEPVHGRPRRRALQRGAEGCEVAFHAAAKVEDWGDPADFERLNVRGTQNVIDACRDAGVRRLVHVGTEAALHGRAAARERRRDGAARPDSPALYPSSKAKAEQLVRDAGGDGPRDRGRAAALRLGPRRHDAAARHHRDGARAGASAGSAAAASSRPPTHIDNTVEGLWLAATKAPAGGVYFVTDGEPVVFRDFITRVGRDAGSEIPDKSVPPRVASVAAAASERIWRLLKRPGPPPLTRFAVWVSSQECTIDISRAERELGYRPVTSREEGLAELRS